MDTHKKILIAEDEKVIAQTYGEHLGRKGYLIEYAYDGEETLKKVESFKPDLVLLDIVMPKLDGIEVLKKLKENEDTKDILVLMLTNLENKESAEESSNLGCCGYLVKTDYSLDELSEKIAEILKNN